MREARFIGMTADGEAIVVELAGEHVRVAAGHDLRKALAGDGQMHMPLEARVSPREVQHRIRCGQTAAEIATATGVAVELIARFEGPVLDERRWHAEQAQRAEVDGMTLAERAEELAGGEVSWDSWLGEDDRWRVRAQLGEHRTATWAWAPHTRRLRALDDVARTIQTGGAAADALDAVLRPVATRRPEPAPEPTPEAEPEPERDVQPDAQPESATTPITPDRSKRRASVPSWDDIVLGTTSRRPPTDPD
jgi:Protein of unknown function (DUF3071)